MQIQILHYSFESDGESAEYYYEITDIVAPLGTLVDEALLTRLEQALVNAEIDREFTLSVIDKGLRLHIKGVINPLICVSEIHEAFMNILGEQEVVFGVIPGGSLWRRTIRGQKVLLQDAIGQPETPETIN